MNTPNNKGAAPAVPMISAESIAELTREQAVDLIAALATVLRGEGDTFRVVLSLYPANNYSKPGWPMELVSSIRVGISPEVSMTTGFVRQGSEIVFPMEAN